MSGSVVAIAYVKAEDEWTVIANEDDENGNAYESVYDAVLGYRSYEDIDREDAMRHMITKLYGIPSKLVEAQPEKFDSLDDS